MKAGQVFCFACGARPNERAPHPGFRFGLGTFAVLAVAWLLLAGLVVVPIVSGQSWRTVLGRPATAASDDADEVRAAANLTAQYQRRVNLLLREVAHIRHGGGRRASVDSLAAILDWARVQLQATRQMAGVFAVVTDSEAQSDVQRFLDDRLHKIQSRLDQVSPGSRYQPAAARAGTALP